MTTQFVFTTLIIGTFASASILGCTRTDHDDRQALQALDDKLDRIEAKLDAVSDRKRPPAKARRLDPNQVYAVPVGAEDAYRGGEHAKVTVVEAFQFTCPHCVGVGHTLHALLDKYDDADLKVVTKHLTGGPGRQAALAACAAQSQGKYAEMEHAIWSAVWDASGNRPRLKDRAALGKDKLAALAAALGMDTARFEADMAGKRCNDQLARHRREMSAFGVTGTPTIFINGRPYVGARTVEAMSAAIDAEIARADRALARGGSIDTYYSQLIAKAKTAP